MSLGLAILGCGKMGRLIEQLAPAHGFEGARENSMAATTLTPRRSHTKRCAAWDVAVDFTAPSRGRLKNIRRLAVLGVNSVVGTTGWLEQTAVRARSG